MKVTEWILARAGEYSTWMLVIALIGLIGWLIDSTTLMQCAGLLIVGVAAEPLGVNFGRESKK